MTRTDTHLSAILVYSPIAALAASLSVFSACGCATALAQPAGDMTSICNGRARATLDDSIRACSLLINWQKNATVRLAILYAIRGDQRYGNADFTAAILDYDAAIRLSAANPHALAMRGLAKWQLGDGDGGKADIAAAMRIDPATAIALVTHAQPAGSAAAASTSSATPTIWNFKGSQVELRADGANRRFYYETPRPELTIAGITAGTLVFEGRKQGNQYAGKAFVFSKKCGARSYDVSGPVDENPPKVTITLLGQRPLVDASCQPTGNFQSDVLTFSYPAQ